MTARRISTSLAWVAMIALSVVAGVATHRLSLVRNQLEQLAGRLTLDAGPESTLIYDTNDHLLSALFEEHRIGVPLSQVSPHVVNAVVAIEDKRFWAHSGIDVRRIVRAGYVNWRAGGYVQGGSTITQQLVRSLFLSREKTYGRKFREAVLARRLEERYSKEEILQAYLNRVYFGDGFYGIETAAAGYFGKPASSLNAVEAATLAGVIKGPSVYSLTKSPERARKRRDVVLAAMRAQGTLSDRELQAALTAPVTVINAVARETPRAPGSRPAHGADYFRDVVARELLARFGPEAVYTGGLRVYTTLDPQMQSSAESVIKCSPKRCGLRLTFTK